MAARMFLIISLVNCLFVLDVCLVFMVYGNFYLFFEGMKAQFGMIWLMEKVYMLLNKGLSGLFLPFLIRVMLVIVQILLH